MSYRTAPSYRTSSLSSFPLVESNDDLWRSLVFVAAVCVLWLVLRPKTRALRPRRRLSPFERRVVQTYRRWRSFFLKDMHAPSRWRKCGNSTYHIDFHSFLRATKANFTACERPNRPPDYQTDQSWYWDMDDDFVIRSSPQWSNEGFKIKTCQFYLEGLEAQPKRQDEVVLPQRKDDKDKDADEVWLTGMCKYANFYKGTTHFFNFYRNTKAHFMACSRPCRPPHFTSSSGSQYWDVHEEFVIRCSSHWSNSCGNIVDCWWTYDGQHYCPYKMITGMCRYEDFERRGDTGGFCSETTFPFKYMNDRRFAKKKN